MPGDVRIRPMGRWCQVEIAESTIKLAEGVPCGWVASPTGEKLVVLTAKGDLGIGWPWGLSSGGSSRPHILQVVWLKHGTIVGHAWRLPTATRVKKGRKPRPGRDKLVCAVWSADERFVVYVGKKSLCIVPVDRESP